MQSARRVDCSCQPRKDYSRRQLGLRPADPRGHGEGLGIAVTVAFFFFQAEDGMRDWSVTGVQTCALPISDAKRAAAGGAFGIGTALFVIGYLVVWSAFAGGATLLHGALDEAGLMSDAMALAIRLVVGSVLVAAGIYQWTPLKEACLRHCRSPLDFLLFHWREGGFGALASGIGHGAYCLGCCWMLMALLFVGGIMNLAWIAAIALLVLIEKTLPRGGWMGRVTGVVLAAWGAVTLAMAA